MIDRVIATMRILPLLSLCAVLAWASAVSDYDDEDDGVKQILLNSKRRLFSVFFNDEAM